MIALRHGHSRQLLRVLSGSHLPEQFARRAIASFCIADFGGTGVCLRSLLYQGGTDSSSRLCSPGAGGLRSAITRGFATSSVDSADSPLPLSQAEDSPRAAAVSTHPGRKGHTLTEASPAHGSSLPAWHSSSRNHALTIAISTAEDPESVQQLCDEHNNELNIFHATAAFHRLGKLIGIRRSSLSPVGGRVEKFRQRTEFLRSELYETLVSVAVHEADKASVEQLCLLLWGLASLRNRNNECATPSSLQKLAKELKRRLQQYAPYGGNAIMLSQATWALSQVMREDAPWQELFLLIGTALMQSNASITAGPASTVLKAAATYKVLHGESPLPPDILDFLAKNLLVTDSRTVGPQAISQGLYALAKLEHHPGDDVLHALAHILPLRITQKVVDRQAIGNSMWALATLGYKPSNLLFKQLMQLVMQHCGNFLSYHYSQVFAALRMWDRRPTAKQMHAICQTLLRNAPEEPLEAQKEMWEPIAIDLQYLLPYYIADDGTVLVPALQQSLDLLADRMQPAVEEQASLDW